MPNAAVIMIQRKALALSPARASRRPVRMVKLLVRRMTVIRATLVMMWKGRGQSAVPLRRNPYATRQAAKVMVSAIMNSHIANFLVGIEKGGSMVRPVGGAPLVKSAWFTAPPNGRAGWLLMTCL